ncbi:hypothetical protein TRFO_29561 [Tritrichomonas foetus]|uniref:Uncharacterized protein n=1 Tax=Tritrichomonas foetus TaxID=1144522 RepID=A0A1J4JXA7_9EUKA|nr:hypothetical protein TRFO_29561 [Tritrichomonas foetus]|eukprot:OHT03096.1 hypothetical protein TRFO_29561 [Tritrichomonas foetus]
MFAFPYPVYDVVSYDTESSDCDTNLSQSPPQHDISKEKNDQQLEFPSFPKDIMLALEINDYNERGTDDNDDLTKYCELITQTKPAFPIRIQKDFNEFQSESFINENVDSDANEVDGSEYLRSDSNFDDTKKSHFSINLENEENSSSFIQNQNQKGVNLFTGYNSCINNFSSSPGIHNTINASSNYCNSFQNQFDNFENARNSNNSSILNASNLNMNYNFGFNNNCGSCFLSHYNQNYDNKENTFQQNQYFINHDKTNFSNSNNFDPPNSEEEIDTQNFCESQGNFITLVNQNQIQNNQKVEQQKKVGSKPHTYEKRRMKKSIERLGEFEISRTVPYNWMMARFGRLITQVEFNKIYLNLKQNLPPQFAPSRDINRSQILRFAWLEKIWEIIELREIVMNSISTIMCKHDS